MPRTVKGRPRILQGVLAILACWLGFGAAEAFAAKPSCDKKLKPLEGSDRSYRKIDDRCEGLFESKVSAPKLEMVSLTYSKVEFDWNENVRLKVFSPISDCRTIRVRGTAVPLDTYYQMDATLENCEVLEWPLKDVLYPEELNDRRIGVLGWIQEGAKIHHTPVVITDAKTAPEAGDEIFAKFRSAVDLQFLQWRWAPFENGRCGRHPDSKTWQTFRRERLRAGRPASLSLAGIDARQFCLEVKAQEVDSDRTVLADLVISR